MPSYYRTSALSPYSFQTAESVIAQAAAPGGGGSFGQAPSAPSGGGSFGLADDPVILDSAPTDTYALPFTTVESVAGSSAPPVPPPAPEPEPRIETVAGPATVYTSAAGAARTYFADANEDGFPDATAQPAGLFDQGWDEVLSLYTTLAENQKRLIAQASRLPSNHSLRADVNTFSQTLSSSIARAKDQAANPLGFVFAADQALGHAYELQREQARLSGEVAKALAEAPAVGQVEKPEGLEPLIGQVKPSLNVGLDIGTVAIAAVGLYVALKVL